MSDFKEDTHVLLSIGTLDGKPAGTYWITNKLRVERIGGREKKYATFGGKMNDTQGSKIYVIHQNGEIIYVGHTTQKTGTRITQSQNAKKYRYKWLCADYPTLELSVFLYPEPEDCESLKHYGESIEAELVYRVRRKTKSWPAAQTEIHFNNAHPVSARREAKKIFSYLTRKKE